MDLHLLFPVYHTYGTHIRVYMCIYTHIQQMETALRQYPVADKATVDSQNLLLLLATTLSGLRVFSLVFVVCAKRISMVQLGRRPLL